MIRVLLWYLMMFAFILHTGFSVLYLRGVGLAEPLSAGERTIERIIIFLSVVGLILSMIKLVEALVKMERPGLQSSKPLTGS